MKCVLAVDTSAALCSLAVHRDGVWVERTRVVERQHNRIVLAELDALLVEAGVRRSAIDGVAFAAGPGSFTGVRIAAALAQGIAFARAARVYPVSSSLALAAASAWREQTLSREQHVVTVIRSRRDACYVAGYQLHGDGAPQRVFTDRLVVGDVSATGLAALGVDPSVARGAGDRPPWWPDGTAFDVAARSDAVVIGRLALEPLQRGAGLAASAALPIYVEGDHPWQAKPA